MKRVAVDSVLADYRPGSGDWGWGVERLSVRSDRLLELAAAMTFDGRVCRDPLPNEEPIMLGDDGRVWSGHHRILAAWLVGAPDVPVEVGHGG